MPDTHNLIASYYDSSPRKEQKSNVSPVDLLLLHEEPQKHEADSFRIQRKFEYRIIEHFKSWSIVELCSGENAL